MRMGRREERQAARARARAARARGTASERAAPHPPAEAHRAARQHAHDTEVIPTQ